MPADQTALLKLGYDGFAKLARYFGKRRNAAKIEKRISAAWRELLKGDAADDATIEAALAAAKTAGDTSRSHVGLRRVFHTSRKPAKGKAAIKPKAKRKPSVKRNAAKRKRK